MIIQDRITIDAPFDRVLHRLRDYLERDRSAGVAGDTAADQTDILLRAGISVISKQVAVQALPPVEKANGAEIALSWAATGATHDLYPSLEATLSIESIDAASTRIRIVGSYLPPLGDLGIVVDHIVGHRIASATLRSFLLRIERHVLEPAPQPLLNLGPFAPPATAE